MALKFTPQKYSSLNIFLFPVPLSCTGRAKVKNSKKKNILGQTPIISFHPRTENKNTIFKLQRNYLLTLQTTSVSICNV